MKLLQTLTLCSALMAATIAATGFAQGVGELTAAKRADIKTLLEASGVRAIPEQIANSTVQSMAGGIRQLDPKFPDKGFGVMRDALVSGMSSKIDVPGGLFEQVTLVYHNAFSAGEVAELVKFYQSPVGKKLLASQSKVNAETVQTAMKWADSIGADLDKRMDEALKKENLKLPEPPKSAAAPAKNGGTNAAPAAAPAKKQ
jgi:uncharacterized protein